MAHRPRRRQEADEDACDERGRGDKKQHGRVWRDRVEAGERCRSERDERASDSGRDEESRDAARTCEHEAFDERLHHERAPFGVPDHHHFCGNSDPFFRQTAMEIVDTGDGATRERQQQVAGADARRGRRTARFNRYHQHP